MCGIVISSSEETGKKLLEIQKHRGIESNYIICNGIFLGHNRLPIQTLENDGWKQPVQISEHVYMLFNGEIFNYSEFETSCQNDVEYLKGFFNLFDDFESITHPEGRRIMNKWDGFWAIALVNTKSKKAVIFTDPLGKKQLYYNTTGSIASEIKGMIGFYIDKHFISQVNKWGYNINNDLTPYDNVKRFLPNVIYEIDLKEFAFQTKRIFSNYFTFGTYPYYDSNIINVLQKSVESRLISAKYNIAMLLSGGLDSTIITYFLNKSKNKDKIKYYTIDNGEDAEYISLCEKFFNIKVERLPEYNMDESILKEIYRINDYPIDLGSVVPQYYLCKSIKENTDCKIILTGDGADEIAGGYRRNAEYDSRYSDTFDELTYYHLPRLDRMSMNFTLELRSPFLGHEVVRNLLKQDHSIAKFKNYLKSRFRGRIPDEIIDRKKHPLKNKEIVTNGEQYRKKVIDLFLNN
jgi:asparagine synthase (glutamine-hydrolysing)